MKKILEIQNLTKCYGTTLGVKDVSFSLNEGEIFGFIGPNGAGKSTTLRTIMNLLNKTDGKILLYGQELKKEDKKLKELIGYLPSEIHLYEEFSVKEMLDYHESFYTDEIHNKRVELVQKLELDETKRIENLSLGNLKKLGIILALMHSPKLLILDEPTSGLDPIIQQRFFELLEIEKKSGTTILYSTHVLSEVSKICDRVGIIKEGSLLTIENMQKSDFKNLTLVTIISDDVKKIKAMLKVELVEEQERKIKFKNTLEINELIKKLAKYKLEKLWIEEATLEEYFLHYYK